MHRLSQEIFPPTIFPNSKHPPGKCHTECPCPDALPPPSLPSPSPQRQPFGIADRNQVGNHPLQVHSPANNVVRPTNSLRLWQSVLRQSSNSREGGSIEDFLDNYLKRLLFEFIFVKFKSFIYLFKI